MSLGIMQIKMLNSMFTVQRHNYSLASSPSPSKCSFFSFFFFSFKGPDLLKKYITSRWQPGLLNGITYKLKVIIFEVLLTIFQSSHPNFKQWLSEFLKQCNSEYEEKNICCPFYVFFLVFMSVLEIIMTIEWHLVDMMLNTNISKVKPFWSRSEL